MSILYIITQADGGGAQKYVLQMAKAFQGEIAAGTEAEKLFADAEAAGIKTHKLKYLKRSINPLFDLLALFEIRSLIQKTNPDIVHLNSSKAGVLGSFAAWGTGAKIVFTAHGFVFLEPGSLAKKSFFLACEKVASTFRNFIITVSEADRQAALRHNLIAPGKIQTIHNGIDPITYLSRQEVREKFNLPLDKKILLTVANDYPTKGLDVLEKAFAEKPMPGAMIAVIGKVSSQKKSGPQIKYLGSFPNAASTFKGFDGLIIPSRKEGFPFVALEAMQAGLPIIATNVGGIPEALGQETGVLVPPEDPEALKNAVETMLSETDKIKSLSEKALARSKLFTLEKTIQETEKIYKKLLKPS